MNSTLIQRKTRGRVLIEKKIWGLCIQLMFPFGWYTLYNTAVLGLHLPLEQPEETLSKWTNETAASRGSLTFSPRLYDALHSPSPVVETTPQRAISGDEVACVVARFPPSGGVGYVHYLQRQYTRYYTLVY